MSRVLSKFDLDRSVRDKWCTMEPFAKLRFSFKIKACEKFYHRHMIDIPRIKF